MKRILVCSILCACAVVFILNFFVSPPALAEEAAQMKTIPAKQIKKEGAAAAGIISREEVEKARAVTPERIYWLIGLWLLIVLAAVLLRWQLSHDNKLYEEGYYSKEL
jgi:hypothetical protein